MHTRKTNHTNITKQYTNDNNNPTSDEMKNTIKTLEELPNYIEKINQKIQHIEKSISKKELDTNRVKAFIQSQSKDNSKLVSERCENEMESLSKKSKQNTDALVLQSIVKASIDNINDVLNFDNNERQRKAKNANQQHEPLNTKSAYAKASYKKKINEQMYTNDNKYKKEDKQKRMKLDISSDNLNSLFIQNKRSALKNNSYIDNSKGYHKQNTFMHNTSVNNGNGVTSGNNIKTDINIDDLSNFLETNEPNPSFLKINKIDKMTTGTNRLSRSPYNSNSNNKNYQFKPKVKQKDGNSDCVVDNDKQYNTHNTNTNNKGVASMISPKSNNKSKNTINSNVNLKHNKSFIIDKVNTINNIHNNNNTNNTNNHYKLNKPTPKKFASFKGPAVNTKKPHTAHSKKENEPSSSSSYKKTDLASHNALSKVNPLKASYNSKNTPSSIRDEASIYYKDIPKQIKNEDLLHLMLFFNEYIISKLPKSISKSTKDAFNTYSLTLSKMIPSSSSKQVHQMNIETDMKVKKVIDIQRKWREFKVKQIASNTKMNSNNELKKMLINNFIEKEGFGIRKIIGMLNTSVESFAQLKTKDALMLKLKCINNKELSNDEKSAMYKNYINSKLSVFNNNCRGNTIFNANDDCNYNALLSSVNDINDITQ